MTRVAFALAALAACGSAPVPPPAPIENVPKIPQADAELAAAVALDFRAPKDLEPRRVARGRATDAYADACVHGDHRACWRAPLVAWGHFNEDAVHHCAVLAAEQCLAGDATSCNALVYARESLVVLRETGRDDREARALCDRGLGAACQVIGHGMFDIGAEADPGDVFAKRGCDLGDSLACSDVAVDGDASYHDRELAAAKAECARGIGRGCRVAAEQDDSLRARTAEVMIAGCRAGVVGECWGWHVTDIESLRAGCAVDADACQQLAGSKVDVNTKRDALEQACQYRNLDACVTLVNFYAFHEYPEPVAGREAALADYLCHLSKRDVSNFLHAEPSDLDRLQVCKK